MAEREPEVVGSKARLALSALAVIVLMCIGAYMLYYLYQ